MIALEYQFDPVRKTVAIRATSLLRQSDHMDWLEHADTREQALAKAREVEAAYKAAGAEVTW